jgi:hypothetical protein
MAIKYVHPADHLWLDVTIANISQLPDSALAAGQSRKSLRIQSLTGAVLKEQQRLAKWFTTLSPKEKAKIIKDVSQLVLARRTRMCNFLEYKGWLGGLL